jgi:hypothetical protein
MLLSDYNNITPETIAMDYNMPCVENANFSNTTAPPPCPPSSVGSRGFLGCDMYAVLSVIGLHFLTKI